MVDVYDGRGQTAAKHFILRRYLQALAFKLLHGGYSALSYVDGFSGPWESKTADHSDTSFMIAIGVLKDAQKKVGEATGIVPEVRCFFAEEKASAYAQLEAAVRRHHDPAGRFFIGTHYGKFEDAVDDIMDMVAGSFALTFIDPTGWTGYEFPKIARLLRHQPGEVLLNYMQPFIDRFTHWDDPINSATFDGILGGPGWKERMDKSLPRSEAALALFTEQFRRSGPFRYVVSTPIERDEGDATFRIMYGTRSDRGLEAYRDAEHDARRNQEERRSAARATGPMPDMFAGEQLTTRTEIETAAACKRARDVLLAQLHNLGSSLTFGALWPAMLAAEPIRKTNAKDICVALAEEGIILPSWKDRGARVRKPDDGDSIILVATS